MALGFLRLAFLASGLFSLVNPPLNTHEGIPYKTIDGKTLTLDVVVPFRSAAPLPAVVVIHGGAWIAGGKEDFRSFSRRLAPKGFVVASINYRMMPQWEFPAPVCDARDAVRYLKDHVATFGIDPARIGVMGASAGGHIAGLVALAGENVYFDQESISRTSPRVQAGLMLYAPADLTDLARTHIEEDYLAEFFGASFEERPDLYELGSPVAYVDKTDPPMLLIHGTTDSVVPYSQSLELYAALGKNQVPAELVPRPGKGHGFTKFPPQETDWLVEKAAQFFSRKLTATSRPAV